MKKTMSFVGSHLDFYGHKKSLYEFENIQAKTVKNMTVFFKEDNVLQETLDEHIFWRPKCIYRENCFDHKNRTFSKTEVEKRKFLIQNNFCEYKTKIELFEKNIIDITHSFGHYAFGHLFDSLQRLYGLKDVIKNKEVKLLVSRFDEIKDFKEHLFILCEKETDERIVIAQENQTINIEKLYFSLTPTVSQEIDKNVYFWIIDKYYNYFKIKEAKPIYNLYLSRNHVKKGSRGVLNNDEVIDFLIKKGYIILYGNEPLKEIINYFANAKTIVGPHGSLFANCMFCNPETEIVEYCPDNRRDGNFKNKFKMAQNYKQHFVEADDLYNIKIPIENV